MKSSRVLRGPKLLYSSSAQQGRRHVSQNVRVPVPVQDATCTTETSSGGTFQIDKEEKTIETAAGILPLSPLMDPSFLEARESFKTPKAKESTVQQKVKWRRILARNPYALALATPSRTCPVTSTTLPRFFFQNFKVVAHPETGDPWWAPQSLLTAERSNGTNGQLLNPASENGQSAGSEKEQKGVVEEKGVIGTNSSGPAAYVAARSDLLTAFAGEQRTSFRNGHKKLGRQSGVRLGEVLNKTIWRDDMSSFVLELMRHRAVEELLELSMLCEQANRKYITRLQSLDDVKNYKHRGCILWMQEHGDTTQDDLAASTSDKQEPIPHARPGEYATFNIEGARYGRKVAVYDLPTLLGADHIVRLRQDSSILADGSIFLLGRQRTLALQLKLWKLLGFIAKFNAS